MQELKTLRAEIDRIDSQIQKLLQERFATVKEIKKVKAGKQLPTQDPKRESEILEKFAPGHEREIFTKILQESRKYQQEL